MLPVFLTAYLNDAKFEFATVAAAHQKIGARYNALARRAKAEKTFENSSPDAWSEIDRDRGEIEMDISTPVPNHIHLVAKAQVLKVVRIPPFYYKYVPIWWSSLKCEQECDEAKQEYLSPKQEKGNQ